jgi:hypothetical protein
MVHHECIRHICEFSTNSNNWKISKPETRVYIYFYPSRKSPLNPAVSKQLHIAACLGGVGKCRQTE